MLPAWFTRTVQAGNMPALRSGGISCEALNVRVSVTIQTKAWGKPPVCRLPGLRPGVRCHHAHGAGGSVNRQTGGLPHSQKVTGQLSGSTLAPAAGREEKMIACWPVFFS